MLKIFKQIIILILYLFKEYEISILPFYFRSIFERAKIHKETSRMMHGGDRWEKQAFSN